jgi:hypothetical protein
MVPVTRVFRRGDAPLHMAESPASKEASYNFALAGRNKHAVIAVMSKEPDEIKGTVRLVSLLAAAVLAFCK